MQIQSLLVKEHWFCRVVHTCGCQCIFVVLQFVYFSYFCYRQGYTEQLSNSAGALKETVKKVEDAAKEHAEKLGHSVSVMSLWTTLSLVCPIVVLCYISLFLCFLIKPLLQCLHFFRNSLNHIMCSIINSQSLVLVSKEWKWVL